MKTVFFVLGMHRSGTSALGGVLNLIGLDFGSELLPANEGNPKGYFENRYVFKLNEHILYENNTSWHDVHFKVQDINSHKFNVYVKEAEKILIGEFKYSEKFVIKDPRISILFPIWEKACQNLNYKIKIILQYRNPLEVAKSLEKRDGFSLERSLLVWSHYVLQAEYLSRQYKKISTTFQDLVEDPVKFIKDLQSFIGIKIDKNIQKELKIFIDKRIKHNNIPLKNFSKDTPAYLKKLVNLIDKKDFENVKKFDRIRNDFYFSLDLFQNKELIGELDSISFLEKRIEELEHVNMLLEKIKETTFFDEEYYKNKYPDLRKTYGNALVKHYIEYGNQEGFHPNAYSEMTGIDNRGKLPLKQQIELKEELISKQKEEIESITREKQNFEETQVKLVSTLSEIEKENEILLTRISAQTEVVEKLTLEKKNLEEKIKDLTLYISELKEESHHKIDSLQRENNLLSKESRDKIKLLQKENYTLKEEQEKIVTLLDKEKERCTYLEKKYEETIMAIKSEKHKIEQLYHEKQKEIEELNNHIDEIVEDLASIKESKCWIYTKPIRDLQKVIKG